MAPWLITTTGWPWIVATTIHGMAGALRRPSETAAIALAAAGLGCLLVFQLCSRHRSTS